MRISHPLLVAALTLPLTLLGCGGGGGGGGGGDPFADPSAIRVTAMDVQAEPNRAYIADHPTEAVFVKLPTNDQLQVGDTITVTGEGAGGWEIRQNDGQTVLTQRIGGMPGAVWTPIGPSKLWTSLESSADGMHLYSLALTDTGWGLHASHDGGFTWTLVDDQHQWMTVNVSADGFGLYGTTEDGGVFMSADGGLTWTALPYGPYKPLSLKSLGGDRLVLIPTNGPIAISDDAGTTWNMDGPFTTWADVAVSADGKTVVAAGTAVTLNGSNWIYVSTDGGITWETRSDFEQWRSIAVSADGRTLLASTSAHGLRISHDTGMSWMRAIHSSWDTVRASADGRKLAAMPYYGSIAVSSDGGETWTIFAPEDSRDLLGFTLSPDGDRMVAVGYGGPVRSSIAQTTIGRYGWIAGGATDAITLTYLGNGTFDVLRSRGKLTSQ